MKDNFIIHYLDKQYQKAGDHFELASTKYHEEAIHQYRVALKRILAVYQFTEDVHPASFDAQEHFSPWKTSYKSFGNIRDLQVTMAVLGEFESKLGKRYKKFRKHLRKSLKQEVKASRKTLRNSVIPPLKEDNDPAFLLWRDLSDEDIVEKGMVFSKKLIDDTRLMMHGDDRKKWHKTRMRIRKLRFIVNLIRKIDEEAVEHDAYKAIKKSGSLLGDWHDNVVLRKQLKKFVKKPKKSPALMQLDGAIMGDQHRQLNKSFGFIEHFLTQPTFTRSGVPAIPLYLSDEMAKG